MLMILKWLLTRNSNLYLPAECLDSSTSVPDKTLVISTLCTLKETSVEGSIGPNGELTTCRNCCAIVLPGPLQVTPKSITW